MYRGTEPPPSPNTRYPPPAMLLLRPSSIPCLWQQHCGKGIGGCGLHAEVRHQVRRRQTHYPGKHRQHSRQGRTIFIVASVLYREQVAQLMGPTQHVGVDGGGSLRASDFQGLHTDLDRLREVCISFLFSVPSVGPFCLDLVCPPFPCSWE